MPSSAAAKRLEKLADQIPDDAAVWDTLQGLVLGHYSRDVGLFSLEEAVRRMTGLPAKWFGFPDRGVLRKGAYADLVVFDPESVNDVGDFVDPARPARGIKMVLVNGTTTWRDGHGTGERPGRVLGRTTAAA